MLHPIEMWLTDLLGKAFAPFEKLFQNMVSTVSNTDSQLYRFIDKRFTLLVLVLGSILVIESAVVARFFFF